MARLSETYDIDEDRIHMVGRSAGGIASDMLGVIRGEEIASIVAFSGGYMSNPENETAIDPALALLVTSPDMEHDNTYTQALIHGGEEDDIYDLGAGLTLPFGTFTVNDATYLNGLGHDTILCNHGLGHSEMPTDFVGAHVVEFFSDHPRGLAASPYIGDGLPSSFPAYCEVKEATTK